MTRTRRRRHHLAGALLVLACGAPVLAQPAGPASQPQALKLYAVEIRTGPAWDPAKAPQDQVHFREHSANLKRLRDLGHLVLGGRYADKGLLLLQAAGEPEARAMMLQDPAIQQRVFAYELHEFRAFYGGTVQPAPRVPLQ